MKQNKLLLNVEQGTFVNAEGVEIATTKLFVDVKLPEEQDPVRIKLRAETNFQRDRLVAALNRGVELPIFVAHKTFKDRTGKDVAYSHLCVELVIYGVKMSFKLYPDAGSKDGRMVPATLEKTIIYAYLGEDIGQKETVQEELPFSD